MTDDRQAAAIEMRRCLYSLNGHLEAICESLPDSPAKRVLGAVIEGGTPEIISLANQVIGDRDAPPKSLHRGYQVGVLSLREEETGQRDPDAAWKQDPDDFMVAHRGES